MLLWDAPTGAMAPTSHFARSAALAATACIADSMLWWYKQREPKVHIPVVRNCLHIFFSTSGGIGAGHRVGTSPIPRYFASESLCAGGRGAMKVAGANWQCVT